MSSLDRGDALWEVEGAIVAPPHEEIIREEQKSVQLRIAQHSLVDGDKDWSDVSLESVQQQDRIKRSAIRVDTRTVTNRTPSNFARRTAQVNRRQSENFQPKIINAILGMAYRVIRVLLKQVVIFVLYALGTKKSRQASSRKRKFAHKQKRQQGTLATKKPKLIGKNPISKSPTQVKPEWLKVENPFIPSSDLYCYWCTRKLGLKSWSLDGHYYCGDCHTSAKMGK